VELEVKHHLENRDGFWHLAPCRIEKNSFWRVIDKVYKRKTRQHVHWVSLSPLYEKQMRVVLLLFYCFYPWQSHDLWGIYIYLRYHRVYSALNSRGRRLEALKIWYILLIFLTLDPCPCVATR
jgi:hypothetical protein